MRGDVCRRVPPLVGSLDLPRAPLRCSSVCCCPHTTAGARSQPCRLKDTPTGVLRRHTPCAMAHLGHLRRRCAMCEPPHPCSWSPWGCDTHAFCALMGVNGARHGCTPPCHGWASARARRRESDLVGAPWGRTKGGKQRHTCKHSAPVLPQAWQPSRTRLGRQRAARRLRTHYAHDAVGQTG